MKLGGFKINGNYPNETIWTVSIIYDDSITNAHSIFNY